MKDKWNRISAWTAIVAGISAFVLYLISQVNAIALNTQYRLDDKAATVILAQAVLDNTRAIEIGNRYTIWMYSGLVASGVIPEMKDIPEL